MRHRRGWILAAMAGSALLVPRPDPSCAQSAAAEDSPIKSNQSLSLDEQPAAAVGAGESGAAHLPASGESVAGGTKNVSPPTLGEQPPRTELPAGSSETPTGRRLTRGAGLPAATAEDENTQVAAAGSPPLRRAPREPGESVGAWSQLQSLWPLVIVLAVIGGGVVILRRLAPGVRAQAPGVLRIAARTVVSPKQHLILIELGRRFVLAGVSSDRIEPLCVIADPEEVSELVGQLRSGLANQSREFQKLLAEESGAFGDPLEESDSAAADSADALGRAGRELSSLLGKLRRMQGTKS